MFRIEMLPAGNGDALWIEYGDDADEPRRVLIDGGTAATRRVLARRIAALPPDRRRFELLVVTHIDGDHIDGILRYLQKDAPDDLVFGDIWFNGWRHLPATVEPLGPVAGEELTSWLDRPGVPWNERFDGEAVVLGDALPHLELDGGLELTLLSPGVDQLRKLRSVWAEEIRKAGLEPGVARPPRPELPGPLERLGPLDVEALARTGFDADGAEANGSSIVLLAEYDDKSVLLGADAHATVLAPAIDRLLADRGEERLALDAFKVSHHGSKANVSCDLLAKLRCSRFLFSTNGDRTHHPNQEAVARVVVKAERPSTLYFNYESDENGVWDNDPLRARWEYETVYPEDGSGLQVDI